jgi:hypothetical protein
MITFREAIAPAFLPFYTLFAIADKGLTLAV